MNDQKKRTTRKASTTQSAPATQGPAGALPLPTSDAIPEWVKLPGGLVYPKAKQVLYLRFRATMTDDPSKGDRQCIVWPISVGDKKLAIGRAGGDANRLTEELAKQFIRAVDGHIADMTGEDSPGNLDVFWSEIGEKCRSLLQRIYVQLHIIAQDEAIDFFENCVAVRKSG